MGGVGKIEGVFLSIYICIEVVSNGKHVHIMRNLRFSVFASSPPSDNTEAKKNASSFKTWYHINNMKLISYKKIFIVDLISCNFTNHTVSIDL